MGNPAARLTDMHTCPMVTPPPHGGGPILGLCASTVKIGGLPAARVTDFATCLLGPPDSIIMGSSSVNICGLAAARVGDPTAHGGVITIGCDTVKIGG